MKGSKMETPSSDRHAGLTIRALTIIVALLTTSFGLGFALNNFIVNKSNSDAEMKKVTGIGGIFFKCKDPNKMKEWYKTHLGLNTAQYGSVFEWRQATDSTKKGFTQWSPFRESTHYFDPSEKDFMINYRVADLEGLVKELKKEGVTVLDTVENYTYGKFVHILDAERNKVELWQPNDIEYEKLGVQMGIKTTK
jgi:predicted enzyme related to lactoylglutathione lyase